MKKVFKYILITFAMIFIVTIIVALCSGKNGEAKKEDVVQVKKEAEKISEYAIVPMTQKGHPKAFKAWGKDGIDKINAAMPNVALMAAKSKSCDKVVDVTLSDRSKAKESIVYMAQCSNNARFYIPFEEVNSNDVPVSVQEQVKTHSDGEYLHNCSKAAKLQVAFPETFDYSVSGSFVNHAANGNVLVKLPIEFKNAFGVPIKKTAMCTFDDRGFTGLSIVQ